MPLHEVALASLAHAPIAAATELLRRPPTTALPPTVAADGAEMLGASLGVVWEASGSTLLPVSSVIGLFYMMAGGRDLSDQGPYVHAAGMPLRGSNHD